MENSTYKSVYALLDLMSLKDARFNSTNKVGNFDPDNPFSGSQADTYFTTSSVASQNITGIDDYDLQTELEAIKSLGTIEITGTEEEEEPMNALAAPPLLQMLQLPLGNRGMSLRSAMKTRHDNYRGGMTVIYEICRKYLLFTFKAFSLS